MKKLVSLLLALALLVSMSSVAFAAKEDFDPELVAAAQAEGELTVYGSCEEPYLAAAAKNFEKEFGIKVSYLRLSTGEVQAKITEEKGNPSADVWFGGTNDPYNESAKLGLLMAYEAKNAKNLASPMYRDADGYWYGIYKGILGFMVNTEELKRLNLEAPKGWDDLLKPEYKDKIWLSNPNTAGTAKLVINTLVQLKGHDEAMKYFVELDKNIAQYTKSGSAAPNAVAIGEAAIALTFSHDALQLTPEGYHIELSFPTDGTGYEVGAMALIKGGKADEQENAKKFIDWMTSEAGQGCYAENDSFRVPTNTAAPVADGLVTLDEVPVIDYDAVWAASVKSEYCEQFENKIATKPEG